MKHIIVSGCARGIGAAIVTKFLQEGYRVTGFDLADEAAVRETFPSENFTYWRGNLSVRDDRQGLVAHAKKTFGEIDGLVNVAGIAPRVRADLLAMSEESYDTVMAVNTKGTLFLTQAVANEMVKQGKGGSIVNISSCSAYTSSTSRGEYCISKAGVSMITKLFADRLAGEGVTVNEICPGIIATDMTAAVKDKYDRLIEGGLVPLGRWGMPEDIAKAVFTLCDGTFGYTTGQSLILDGGMHIRKL